MSLHGILPAGKQPLSALVVSIRTLRAEQAIGLEVEVALVVTRFLAAWLVPWLPAGAMLSSCSTWLTQASSSSSATAGL